MQPGTKLGAYEVVAKVGQGGMGEVYRARDLRLNRDVALKIVPDAFAADADRVARFTREAQTLAALNHPHIAQVYGIEETATTRALVMEFVDGETLADRIARGPLPVAEAVLIAVQIADALEAAHDAGIVHRDLKPANIKLRPSGTVKVLDFGLAKAVGGRAGGASATEWAARADAANSPTITTPAVTHFGVILGTAAYMSPEQARGKDVDHRTDIWAFGCVLYEMLTAHGPFRGETVSDVIAKVLEREPDWNALPASTPGNVRRVLRRCLERDVARRWHDIADARLDLLDADTPLGDATRPPARSRWLAPALFAAAVAVAAMAAAVIVNGRRETAPPWKNALLQFSMPTGNLNSLAISDDGQTIAWVAPKDGEPHVWVRTLADAAPRALDGTARAALPFIAPDGRAVGFFANGELKRADVATGTVERLAGSAALSLGGSWSRHDTIVYSNRFGLYRIAATGGESQLVAPLNRTYHENSLRFPQFLPDGRHFVYVARSGRPDESGAYLGSLDAPPRRLFATLTKVQFAPPEYLLYVRGATLMAQRFNLDEARVVGEPVAIAQGVGANSMGMAAGFAVSSTNVLAIVGDSPQPTSTLQWRDRSGRNLGIVGGAAPYNQFRVAPDGTRVAASITNFAEGSRSIWLLETGRPPSRWTFPGTHDWEPVWSGDGTRIGFGSYRDGPLNLYVKAVTGDGGEQPLVISEEQKNIGDWSRDGEYIAYREVRPSGGGDIVVLRIRDKSETAVTRSEDDERVPRFSPDGRWIAYVSEETGRPEVHVQPFPPTGAKWEVSSNGGDEPVWRGDGRELYYIDQAGMLNAVAVDDKSSTFTWKPLGTLFRTGPSLGPGFGSRYDAAPDGSRFLVAVAEPAPPAPAGTLMLNWTTRLGSTGR